MFIAFPSVGADDICRDPRSVWTDLAPVLHMLGQDLAPVVVITHRTFGIVTQSGRRLPGPTVTAILESADSAPPKAPVWWRVGSVAQPVRISNRGPHSASPGPRLSRHGRDRDMTRRWRPPARRTGGGLDRPQESPGGRAVIATRRSDRATQAPQPAHVSPRATRASAGLKGVGSRLTQIRSFCRDVQGRRMGLS